MSRLGVSAVGIQGLNPSPEMVLELADLAQDLRYESYWIPETTGPEAFVMLGALARSAGSMALGIGVTPLQLRPPTVAAMAAATLAQLSDRNIYLGVGVSSPAIVARWHGVQYGEGPVSMAREYLTIVQRILAEGRLDYAGRHYHIDGFRLAMPTPPSPPKLVIGALNPAMLYLAGQQADAVLLAFPLIEELSGMIAQVRDGEVEAHRPLGSCKIMAYLRCYVGEIDDHMRSLQQELLGYMIAPGYARRFRRTHFADQVDKVQGLWSAGKRREAVAAIAPDFVRALTHAGTTDDLRGRLDDYTDNGVDYCLIVPVSMGPDPWATTVRTVRALRPASPVRDARPQAV